MKKCSTQIFLVTVFYGLSFLFPVKSSSDEFLDAVVNFIHPPGSNFSEKSESLILGQPDTLNVNVDVPESLIVAFIDNIVIDGPGDDLLVAEHIGGDSLVNVYGSADGVFYEFFAQSATDVRIDLADFSLETVRYIRIDGLGNGGTTPGYEFDGAVALNSMDRTFYCDTSFHLNAVLAFEFDETADDDGSSFDAVIGRPDAESISVDSGEILEVGFADIKVVDGPGVDLYIYEDINLDSRVRVFGSSDGADYQLLGEPDRSFAVDLADFSMDTLRFLRFEGLDDGGEVPGFELDSAVAINFECVEILVGDANLDGQVDLFDVERFVFYIVNQIYIPQVDTNHDGQIDILDISGFIGLLGG
ncbi:MAG: hypothetical protein AAGA30_17825 [Planctomycetota bacterium]